MTDNRIVAPNLASLYLQAADRYGRLPAFATRQSPGRWEPVSFRELAERGLDLATALIDLGVEPRHHVGLFSDNRLEWIWADYAIQFCGAVNVPRGADVTDSELEYIIEHSGMSVAFVESKDLADRIRAMKDRLHRLKKIILTTVPDGAPPEGTEILAELRDRGRQMRASGDRRALERVEEIEPEDLFTLIYTSGTTGRPKGVMLTHANMMSQMEMIPISLNCTDRVLSILPVWHIFERVFEVYTISCGACTYYSGVRTLADDLRQVEPTFMGSAPRLWESLHQRILATVQEAHPMRRLLFRIGYYLANRYKGSIFHLRGQILQTEKPSVFRQAAGRLYHLLRWLLVIPWYGFFNVAVLEPIRQSAGGSLKATISGGGALPVEIDRFFNDIGIPVLEGYGLTETCPVIAVRTYEKLVVGTVGPLMPGTDVKIVDPDSEKTLYPDPDFEGRGRGRKGEIWVRGPQVMKGYYRQPDLTAETIRDGWLRTGDLGMITWNDCLRILGRRKSTIVLSSGENLEPEPIEMRLNQSLYIDQCMVVGQDQKQIALLVVPSRKAFEKDGFCESSLRELAGRDEVRQKIRSEIRRLISRENGFKRHELVREFRLLHEPFETGEELTSLFKLRRHVIHEKYADLIREIYENGETSRS